METLRKNGIYNINDRITFKVTDRGRQVLADRFAKEIESVRAGKFADEIRGAIAEVAERTVADDGTVTMSLWEMATTFGPHQFPGSEQVIEANSFTFKEHE